MVKEKNSLFISSHVPCVQINFKGAQDVGRRLCLQLSVICVWSPPQQASRCQLTDLSLSLESCWVSYCKLNMKQTLRFALKGFLKAQRQMRWLVRHLY